MLHRNSIFAVIVLIATGCGSDSKNSVGKPSDAAAGWKVAEQAMNGGIDSFNDEEMASGSVSGTIDCPDGGSVEVAGATTEGGDGAIPENLTITYDACKSDGVTVSGEIEYKVEFSLSDFSMVVTTTGSLTFSGDVQGDCEVDLTMTSSMESNEPEMTGTICGYDAADFASEGQ